MFAAVDSHTEGMPTRVITGGVGVLPGASMADRRLRFLAESDGIRRLLMTEPRGHPPMCGHGTIGVASVLVETGMVRVVEPITTVRLDTPAGVVVAEVQVDRGHAN